MKIVKRIKNLWRLSEYHLIDSGIDSSLFNSNAKLLTKDFPTIQKKMATIIQEKERDIFNEEIKEV